MPFSSKGSPLPSYTPPRSGASTPLRFSGVGPSSSAIAEKLSMSYGRGAGSRSMARRIQDCFVGLRIPLGGGGSIAAGGKREIVVPVLAFLHPSRQPGAGPASVSMKRRDSHAPHSVNTSPATTIVRVIVAIVGTVLCLFVLISTALTFAIKPAFRFLKKPGSLPFTEPSTVVLSPEELERIWRWEIASGHYPSRRPVGIELGAHYYSGGDTGAVSGTSKRVENPGLPRRTEEDVRREREVQAEVERRLRDQGAAGSGSPLLESAEIVPVGAARRYIDLPISRGTKNTIAYPPRPAVGAGIDLDAVMDHCDFATNRYVRDCLEVLRVNGGLTSPMLRRGDLEAWRTTFVSAGAGGGAASARTMDSLERHRNDMTTLLRDSTSTSFASLLASRQQLTLTSRGTSRHSHVYYTPHPSHPTADPSCDPDYPHLFHIFWAGPFTDKPYAAALSFLYTQNLALSKPIGAPAPQDICRPQLWIWINPGPASSLPDKHAVTKMRNDLRANPWSAPLLHKRFAEVVQFKLWNTTEQLDGVSEMKGWRDMRLFNSGGVKYGSNKAAADFDQKEDADVDDIEERGGAADSKVAEAEREEMSEGALVEATAEAALSNARQLEANSTMNATGIAAPLPTKHKDELFERVGSTSQKYDRLTVVLSDMARFVLTHRFGGVYLDADTLLLRDWQELFGWHGAFAYRWSRLEKYNTAVLKMQRGSALGNFLFRTAVANGLDFHPMTISRYTKDAGLEGLLLRLPDALFDPAWLNTEYYQRDRPPFPYLERFEEFFETPKKIAGPPAAVGFSGFYQGAFSYHYHNGWWMPFDPARNFPDLGPRFESVERLARGRLLAAKLAALPPSLRPSGRGTATGPSPTKPNEQPAQPTGALPGQKMVGPTGSTGKGTAHNGEEDGGPKWGDDERDFDDLDWSNETVDEDERDLSWSAVLKRTFEAYLRGETPNMYGEWINWSSTEEEQGW